MQQQTTIFQPEWLVDGLSGDVRKQVLVLVRDGVVEDISESKQYDKFGDRKVVRFKNCGFLPGFVDSHVHISYSGSIDQRVRKAQLSASDDELHTTITEHLRQNFTHGILGLRDAGDQFDGYSIYKRGKMRQESIPVNVESAGMGFFRKGFYGAFLGHPHDPATFSTRVEKMSGEKRFVKIVNSGMNSLQHYDAYQRTIFGTEELTIMINKVATLGMQVMVHANGPEAVRAAVEAGCASIEHGYFMGRDNLKRMADNGTYWVPTIYAMKACLENFEFLGQGAAKREVIKKNVEDQMAQLALARELGVKVAVGTDSGSFGVLHGESFVEELNLFKKAGFSLAELVRCGSGVGAQLCGFDTFGTIEVGKPATFLVVRGVPSQMPRKMGYLEHIYLDGKPSVHYLKHYRQIDHLRSLNRS